MLCLMVRCLAIKPKYDYILCTIHRAKNTDDEQRLGDIFEALNEISQDKQIILPLHPRTKKIKRVLLFYHN